MYKKITILFILLLLFSIILKGEEPYRIHPGDSIRIIITGPSIQIYSNNAVDYKGNYTIISYNRETNSYESPIGIINIQNLTLQELNDSLTSFIKHIWPNAQLTWDILSPLYSVSITYQLNEDDRISQTIPYQPNTPLLFYIKDTQSQLSPRTSDIFVVHRNGDKETVSYDRINSYIPSWGDMIYFIPKYVTVTGGVKEPGKYPYEEGKDAYYYIREAGGTENPFANINSSKIIKSDGRVISIKKDHTIEGGDHIQVPNPLFFPKDIASILLSATSIAISIYMIVNGGTR